MNRYHVLPLVKLNVERKDPDCQRPRDAEQLELEVLDVLLDELNHFVILVIVGLGLRFGFIFN
jgi:hypothetical protein